MLIEEKASLEKEKYFKHKYFIRPFVCKKCGNKFMFERGSECMKYIFLSPIYEGDKFCDLCTIEIDSILEKFPKEPAEDELRKRLENWLNGWYPGKIVKYK